MNSFSLTDLERVDHRQPILIAGPTASGKSDLAMEVARRYGGLIVNADAIQVYSNWRILSARPSAQDEAEIDHALYGHLARDAHYSVGHWLREVRPLIRGAKRPIITGGTGLYFTALTQGLAELPAISESLRQEANARVQQYGYQVLLKDIDADTQQKLDIQNPMRVQRAWEVQQATGKSLSYWHAQTPAPDVPLENCCAIVMQTDTAWLNTRIEQRFDKMVKAGALKEAEEHQQDWNEKLLSSKAIGARELIAHLRGQLSLEQAQQSATIATRQFAKRQRTWFRSKMKHWHWFDATNSIP